MVDRLKDSLTDDPWGRGGRVAAELARKLVALDLGVGDLEKLLDAVGVAEAEVESLRQEVERTESRFDEAAVHAAETMVSLRNAAAELGDNREQLVEGGLADEAMLADLDYQIESLERRVADVKAGQSSENRVIDEDLSPERDLLVAGELQRQTVTEQLIGRVFELKPDPCPESLQGDFDALELLRQSL